ncbi:Conserved oligomeric Golgi complex subunit 6 [Hypsizygus marmoreus]|uniref:Conserved oligomeric Golgi complex subunit 6 n=1 Tax=Hypsizygus marmoreus TaxID=39966 RepID=A0A369JNS0_HYPMA|nr:Conserved oligomeric Golgi complex subunit 6 [Hypsizygus marmoreus]
MKASVSSISHAAPSSSSLSSERKQSLTPQSRNPVSVRLYKVLGSNFEDEATREALQTLSDLYVTSGPSKSTEDTSTDTEDAEYDDTGRDKFKDSTPAIPGESAARARRNLRRDMENRLTKGSQQFLNAFGEVDQKLDELQQHIHAMHASCDDAERQLELTTAASKTLLERAGSLREERQEVENKKSIVTAFLTRFTLNDEEVEAITSRDEPVGERFFAAMDKTERIRDDCRNLMSGEDGPTKAGLDIMASMSSNLEHGYEKIFRWCSHEFRQMGRDIHLEVSPVMREAVRRLRKRPELLTEALTFLSQTRQATLLSSFLTALTRGGPSGLPRPIELHAHDPMRYVGDMLAWVHQAMAAERELLEALFGLMGDGRMVGSVRVFDGKSEEEDWIREMMDLCVAKLCVPLKVRVQQTIRSQESSIVSYKIANLLQFYMLTMRRTIGAEALLSKTLLEITDVAYNVFYDSISAQGRAILRVPLDMNDPSLTPPLAILDHVQILREIMTVYQSSFLGEEDESEQVAGFQKILDIMIDPAIEMCCSGSEEKRWLRPRWDQPVYVLNCLSYLQSMLEPFSFTNEKQEAIQSLIEERVSTLIDEHFMNIMNDAGIYQVAEICTNHELNEPLSRLPSMQPSELQSALRRFSDWLSGVEVVQSARLSQLAIQRLHTQIHHAALERMARAYQTICEEVKKPENKYEAASTLLGSERPFGQVHLLRQIFGLGEGTD